MRILQFGAAAVVCMTGAYPLVSVRADRDQLTAASCNANLHFVEIVHPREFVLMLTDVDSDDAGTYVFFSYHYIGHNREFHYLRATMDPRAVYRISASRIERDAVAAAFRKRSNVEAVLISMAVGAQTGDVCVTQLPNTSTAFDDWRDAAGITGAFPDDVDVELP